MTGVQTCALPISRVQNPHTPRLLPTSEVRVHAVCTCRHLWLRRSQSARPHLPPARLPEPYSTCTRCGPPPPRLTPCKRTVREWPPWAPALQPGLRGRGRGGGCKGARKQRGLPGEGGQVWLGLGRSRGKVGDGRVVRPELPSQGLTTIPPSMGGSPQLLSREAQPWTCLHSPSAAWSHEPLGTAPGLLPHHRRHISELMLEDRCRSQPGSVNRCGWESITCSHTVRWEAPESRYGAEGLSRSRACSVGCRHGFDEIGRASCRERVSSPV